MIGPLVGIMTSPKNEQSLAGNLNLFIRIQNELLSRGAHSFVFSFQDVKDDGRIIGYTYTPKKQEWHRAVMPFPDIVYNRIPFRQSEQTLPFRNCVQLFKERQIPLFNPGFIDKYELFQILASSKQLIKYLPITVLIDSKDTLKKFHKEYSDIYIKPRMLSKGKNIFRLYGDLILESNSQKFSYSDFEEFWIAFGEAFSDGSYIAQRTIRPALIDGKRYDFRILSHWSATEKNYRVTGIGIRATDQFQLTTHIVNGGFIMPYEKIQEPKHDWFISSLVKEIGLVLTQRLGFLGEFSIDAGVNSDGQYVVYEVNSKPMSFDEEGIEQKRIHLLCDLFFQLTVRED
jgi:hypothetical protein